MSKIGTVFLAAGLSCGLGVVERVADPFDRHTKNYTLEGPVGHSELFYLSTNWYDEVGKKHNDRTGDALMLGGMLSALGFVALGKDEA